MAAVSENKAKASEDTPEPFFYRIAQKVVMGCLQKGINDEWYIWNKS